MRIQSYKTKIEMAEAAADAAARALKDAIAEKGSACFVAATGASQFEFLRCLTNISSVSWRQTTMFHLDEYIGMTEHHPASFRKYLKQRLVDVVHPGVVHFIHGDAASPKAEARRVGRIISQNEIDVAFVGVGENGHLAFNDPPADLDTQKPYTVVDLDDRCRRQQLGEGWFGDLEEVPTQAISMSISQIMKSIRIIAVVPESRKAEAVQNCFGDSKISPLYPASILKDHPKTTLYLDKESSVLLKSPN